jgi:hypothetical protein
MNSLPPERRGVGAGMSATFQNSAMVLSIGVFFSLIILGLAGSLPGALDHGLIAQGLPRADAARIAALPPVSVMFAALLGYNPVQTLLGPAIGKLSASHAAYLTGHTFFPSLIAGPFRHGLGVAFAFSIAACVIAAIASLLRGGKYVHDIDGTAADATDATVGVAAGRVPAVAGVTAGTSAVAAGTAGVAAGTAGVAAGTAGVAAGPQRSGDHPMTGTNPAEA